MLTRLKVNGFKNLVDVDVRFGPFTCIAGVNGSGKSNLFDAIRFLAALAEKPLVEAALSIVRGEGGRSADIRSLFHRVGDQYADEMSFEAEMVIPSEGFDDLGMKVKAASTFLRYSLVLAYQGFDGRPPHRPLQIVREELVPIAASKAQGKLGFPHRPLWRKSAVFNHGGRREPIILTVDGSIESMPGPDPPSAVVQRPGRLNRFISENQIGQIAESVNPGLTRTLLSFRVGGSPELTLARQEMLRWRVFQLDPASMRVPDDVAGPTTVGGDGAHVAATLYSIAHEPSTDGRDPYEAETAVYARVANRIRRLIGDIWDLTVERDDKREEFTLYVTDRNGTRYSARELSDGTLRFLALAVIEEEQKPELLCIEEPENGVHPGRIESLLKLLQAVAMDTHYPIEEGNPLRQVIISTHSPSVVLRAPEDSLVVAELWPSHDDRGRLKRARFRGLTNTWRDPSPDRSSVALGTLLDYLNPEGYRPLPEPDPERGPDAEVRVMDRADLHNLFSPIPRVDG
jgi:predicted ATPase